MVPAIIAKAAVINNRDIVVFVLIFIVSSKA
jgi:hypothetical protein